MLLLSINKLKESQHFVENVRWDVTPRVFLEPASSAGESGEPVDITHGYMLYVDVVDKKPVLVIMQLKRVISRTVGYVSDVPEELLREAMHCTDSECISGMYPLGDKLEGWLKKEFGLS